jgi:phage tail sheath protein FI
MNESRAPRPLLVGDGPLALGAVRLQGGQDGLSKVDVLDFTGGLADMRGLRLLEDINEVSILCVPDAVFEAPIVLKSPAPPAHDPCSRPPKPPVPDPAAEDPTARPPAFDEQKVTNIYRTMIEQCERLRDRVAILEAPAERRTPQQLSGWAQQFPTRFAALYHPWLKIPDPAELGGPTRRVPPGGHVAGIYARIDNQFGVQRPPANAALEFVTEVVDDVNSLQQENLNPYGVNVIRSFAGRGIRVWGARSLAGAGDADWRYIHTRRLMSMIEESVDHSMQWAVFEPNNEALRRTLVHSLSVFLETIWRKGGLKGAVPSEGFYVRCDETNNPGSVVDLGKIVCQVGVAVAAPMEFLVFEIRHMPGGAQILEF